MIPTEPDPRTPPPGIIPMPSSTARRIARWTRDQCIRLRWEAAPLAGAAAYGLTVQAYAAATPGWGEPAAFAGTSVLLAGATLPLVDRQPVTAYATGVGSVAAAWGCWQLAAGPSLGGTILGSVTTIAASIPYWRFIAARRDHHADQAVTVDIARYQAMGAVAAARIPAPRDVPALETTPASADLPTATWPGARTGLPITDPIAVSDRTAINLVGGHVLVGGGTDAGKSNIVHVIACTVLARTNARLLGIDMKPGSVELGVYRKAGARIASSKSDALDLLHWIRDEGERRGELMGATIHDAGTLTRSWTATEQDPHLVLVIDELAELVDAAPKAAHLLKSHTRLLRAMGITVLAATQSPSRHVFGGDSDSRGQYGTRICVATFEPTQTNIILGQGAHGAGWRADQLDGRGSFLIQSRQHRDPRPDRAYWMTDRALADHVNAHATGRPAQHRDAEPEAFARPAAASFTPTGSITGDILAYLDDRSATPREVADAIGGNADSVRARISQLAAKGELVNDGNGNYKTTKEGKVIAGNVIRFRQHRKA